MKRLLACITTGLCLLANLSAQTFHSIPIDSVYWVEYNDGPYMGNTSCWQQIRRLIYPTTTNFIYGGKTFTEYRCTEDWSFFSVIPNQCPSGFVSSDMPYAYLASDPVTKTVYRYDSSLFIPETMIYDFSKGMGDTILFNECFGDSFIVSVEDSIDIGGEYRRRIGMNGAGIMENDTIYLIEGIGSSYGLAYNQYCPFEYTSKLVCYHYKEWEYGNTSSPYCTRTLDIPADQPETANILEFTGTDICLVNVNTTALELCIYDLSGKIVHRSIYDQPAYMDLSNLAPGVYFATATVKGELYKPFKFMVSH